VSPNPTRRRRRARRESYAGLSGCREERACLASEPRAVVHPDVRGRSTTRGGFACEVWRVGVRDLPGSRARSPGLACEVSRVGVRDLPGWRARSPGLACEISRVGERGLPSWRARSPGYRVDLFVHIAPSRAGACAGRPWSRTHARRDVVPGRRGHRSTVDVTRSAIDREAVVDRPRRGGRWGGTYPPPPLDVASPACAHGRAALFACSPARRVAVVGRYGHCRTSLWTLSAVAMDHVRRHLGHCRPWLWTLSGATLDIARRHLGHCPTPPWTLPDATLDIALSQPGAPTAAPYLPERSACP